MTGTHTGALMGAPATGRRIETDGLALYRFRDGQIVEAWERSDDLGLLQQLGLIPEMTE